MNDREPEFSAVAPCCICKYAFKITGKCPWKQTGGWHFGPNQVIIPYETAGREMPLQNQNFPMIAIQCRPRHRLRSSVLALVITIWLPSSVSADQGNDTATQVKKLLEVGWNASNENYSAAQAQFRQAKNDAPGDVRVDFAMRMFRCKTTTWRKRRRISRMPFKPRNRCFRSAASRFGR